MSPTTYRAGIIGLGFIGGGDQVSGDRIGQVVKNLDGNHREAWMNHPRIELAAGSDRDEGRRERFAERTGARTYDDWREMLESEELDAVSIATYATSHAELAVGCAERGVRVIYCEKPIATRLDDARRMLDACDASGSLLVINHNRRFNPNYRRLSELIASGGLGELTSVNLQWGTGRLGNLGTHAFDATCMLTGRRIEAVSGTLDLTGRPDCRGPEFRDPGAWGLLRLEGGLMATVDGADRARLPFRLTLNGTAGRAVTGSREVDLRFNDGRDEHWPSAVAEATSMDRAVGEMVGWLDDGGPFAYPADDSVHVLEAILGFHASHGRQSAWTSLPLSGADRELEVLSG